MKKNYSEFLNPRSPKNGFTLVEMMISISILGILLAISISALNNKKGILNLEDAQASIINALGQAQNRAATGVGNIDIIHGVCIDTSDNTIAPREGNVCGTKTSLPCSISTNQSIIEFNRLSGGSGNTATIKINCVGGLTKEVIVTKDGAIIPQ